MFVFLSEFGHCGNGFFSRWWRGRSASNDDDARRLPKGCPAILPVPLARTTAHPIVPSKGNVYIGGIAASVRAQYEPRFYPLAPSGIAGRLLRIAGRAGICICAYLPRIITKSEILSSTELQPGVFLSNRGDRIMGSLAIGAGTVIHDRVTIGMNLFDGGIPTIVGNVWIGPNCIIYGNIRVGDGVTIFPNAVLTKSVPDSVVLQGNPACIVRSGFDNTALHTSLATDFEAPPVETGSS